MRKEYIIIIIFLLPFSDISFYIVELALVVWSFIDEMIKWHEATILFTVYIIYCTVMKYNVRLEVRRRFLIVVINYLYFAGMGTHTNSA